MSIYKTVTVSACNSKRAKLVFCPLNVQECGVITVWWESARCDTHTHTVNALAVGGSLSFFKDILRLAGVRTENTRPWQVSTNCANWISGSLCSSFTCLSAQTRGWCWLSVCLLASCCCCCCWVWWFTACGGRGTISVNTRSCSPPHPQCQYQHALLRSSWSLSAPGPCE